MFHEPLDFWLQTDEIDIAGSQDEGRGFQIGDVGLPGLDRFYDGSRIRAKRWTNGT
jgi:hypothetical protein